MNRLGLTWSTAALALMAAAQPAQAQDSDIIVTARRVEERLQDVPISITAFSQQQLTNRNIVSAGDIAVYTPSLAANSRFGPEKTSFSIRGFNQDNGTAPSVGVYFADVPALRSVGGTTTGNGAGPGAFFDLANVQVLKGPQGTLFGRNTSGGAVLLVPQKPTGDFGGYVEGSIGNYNMRRVQAVVNVPVLDTLRVRLGVDRQTRDGYMKNISSIGARDYNDIDYTALRLSVVADLTPNLENYFIATYSKSVTNGFMPRLFTCDANGRSGAVTAANEVLKLACAQADRTNARGFYEGEAALNNPSQRIEQWQLINTTTWKAADNLTVKNILSYGQFRESLRATVYGENLAITSGPNAGQSAIRVFSNPFPGRETASLSTFTEELQFQGTLLSDRLNWQAGAYLEVASPLGYAGALSTNTGLCPTANPFQCTSFYASQDAANLGTAGASSPTLTARSNKYAFQDYGLYAQGTYKLTEQLSFTAGLRYTRDHYQATSRQITFAPITAGGLVTGFNQFGTCLDYPRFGNPGTATNPGTLSEAQCETYQRGHSSAFTWLADIDYKPWDDVLLYAKYARGYRQGGLKTEGYSLSAFNPEKIDAYEIGLKTTWRGAVRGTFNVAAFYNDFSQQQITTSGQFASLALTPAQLITNVGKSRIAGVEVDASISPVQGLQFDFGYAHLDTKVKEIDRASLIAPSPFTVLNPSGALVGYPLTFAPRNKFTVTGTYTLPLDESVGRISLGATFTHTDSQEATYQTIDCATANPATGNGVGNCASRRALGYDIGKLPALDLLNININWNSVAGGPVDLALFATNVTKRKYATATFGGYTSFGFEAMSVGEPRMYGVRLKYRFGD
ncbi:MAG: TonB-dependent receptor [Sphingobium sp.]